MHQALDICREFNGAARTCPASTPAPASIRTTRHEADDAALAKLDSLLAEPEVIACGEIGLDYYHEGAPHDSPARGPDPAA